MKIIIAVVEDHTYDDCLDHFDYIKLGNELEWESLRTWTVELAKSKLRETVGDEEIRELPGENKVVCEEWTHGDGTCAYCEWYFKVQDVSVCDAGPAAVACAPGDKKESINA